MATQAIIIKIKTPTNTKGARIVVSMDGVSKEYNYCHALDTEANAMAGVRSYMEYRGLEGDFALGENGSASYVAVMLPPRYVKARDAVIAVRRAMSQGDLHGNPHAKQWGQQITDLTDGVQKDGFAREYLQSL